MYLNLFIRRVFAALYYCVNICAAFACCDDILRGFLNLIIDIYFFIEQYTSFYSYHIFFFCSCFTWAIHEIMKSESFECAADQSIICIYLMQSIYNRLDYWQLRQQRTMTCPSVVQKNVESSPVTYFPTSTHVGSSIILKTWENDFFFEKDYMYVSLYFSWDFDWTRVL